jgi:hypothetical protein
VGRYRPATQPSRGEYVQYILCASKIGLFCGCLRFEDKGARDAHSRISSRLDAPPHDRPDRSRRLRVSEGGLCKPKKEGVVAIFGFHLQT